MRTQRPQIVLIAYKGSLLHSVSNCCFDNSVCARLALGRGQQRRAAFPFVDDASAGFGGFQWVNPWSELAEVHGMRGASQNAGQEFPVITRNRTGKRKTVLDILKEST